MPSNAHAVLITGCSTGIGRETAKLLAATGRPVYATARRLDSIADLEAAGCRLLELDVTSETSARAAVEAVEGGVGVLVNNAGVNELGPIETLPLDRVRAMFETNLFGLMRMCQLVLPGMRAQGEGRIVNVGSMNGRLTFPGMGSYCATKHAIEATSDALRHEVRPFGVDVSLIQPGMVTTGLGKAAVERRSDDQDGPYSDYMAAVAESAMTYQDGPMARLACAPEDVAETIRRAIEDDRPRARYRVAGVRADSCSPLASSCRMRRSTRSSAPSSLRPSPPRRGSARPEREVMLALCLTPARQSCAQEALRAIRDEPTLRIRPDASKARLRDLDRIAAAVRAVCVAADQAPQRRWLRGPRRGLGPGRQGDQALPGPEHRAARHRAPGQGR